MGDMTLDRGPGESIWISAFGIVEVIPGTFVNVGEIAGSSGEAVEVGRSAG